MQKQGYDRKASKDVAPIIVKYIESQTPTQNERGLQFKLDETSDGEQLVWWKHGDSLYNVIIHDSGDIAVSRIPKEGKSDLYFVPTKKVNRSIDAQKMFDKYASAWDSGDMGSGVHHLMSEEDFKKALRQYDYALIDQDSELKHQNKQIEQLQHDLQQARGENKRLKCMIEKLYKTVKGYKREAEQDKINSLTQNGKSFSDGRETAYEVVLHEIAEQFPTAPTGKGEGE